MKRRRKFNTRRVKVNVSYSIPELSRLLGVHKNTILHWIKDGLPLLDDRRPFLFHGSRLIDFLKVRQTARKKHCKLQELFCFQCQAPRLHLGDMVDIHMRSKSANMSALCSVCEKEIFKIVSLKSLPDLQKLLLVQQRPFERI